MVRSRHGQCVATPIHVALPKSLAVSIGISDSQGEVKIAGARTPDILLFCVEKSKITIPSFAYRLSIEEQDTSDACILATSCIVMLALWWITPTVHKESFRLLL